MKKQLLLLLLLLLVSFVKAQAQNFAPDPNFGTNGYVKTIFGTPGRSYTWDFVHQQDGNLLVAGWTLSNTSHISIARYDEVTGELDPSLRGTGKANIRIADQPQCYEVVQQPDGKIVIAGSSGFEKNPMVFRMNADGSLDKTFGHGGRYINSFQTPVTDAEFTNVKILPDGKILCAGYFSNFANEMGFIAVRLNADGSEDSTFGYGGKAKIEAQNSTSIEAQFCRATFTSDNKILFSSNAPSKGTIVLARMTSDGLADNSFGDDGFVFTKVKCSGSSLQQAVELPNGNYAVGFSLENDGFGVAAFNKDGSSDVSFGHNGSTIVKEHVYYIYDFYHLSLTPDNKLLLTGNRFESIYDTTVVIRFNADGSIDNTFDENGQVSLPTFLGFPNGEMTDDHTLFVSGTVDGAGDGFNMAKMIAVNSPKLQQESLNSPSEIQLYPNPAPVILNVNISSAENPVSLKVISLTGNVVIEKYYEDESTIQLDISKLSPGIYSVEVNTGDHLLEKKFVKN